MRPHVRLLGGLVIVVSLGVPIVAQRGARDGQWRSYNGDMGSTKYAPLDQINKNNVKSLRIVWRRPAVDSRLTATNPKLTFSNNFRARRSW